MDGWMDGCMDGWMYGWMSGWIDLLLNGNPTQNLSGYNGKAKRI